MKEKPIHVSTIGLNSRSINTFEFFFKKNCKGRYLLCDDHADSSVALVDVDIAGSDTALKECLHRYPEKPIVNLSITGTTEHVGVCVKKPINSAELVQILDDITRQPKSKPSGVNDHDIAEQNKTSQDSLTNNDTKKFNYRNTSRAGEHLGKENESDFFGDNQDIDIKDKKAVSRSTYSPGNMLQGALVEGCILARDKSCIVQVRYLGVNLIIDGLSSTVHTAIPYSILRPTCLLRSSETPKFSCTKADGLKAMLSTLSRGKNAVVTCMDIDAFIWRVSLWSSRGRVPETTDLSLPVYLIYWPNLTRLDNIPHAPRIAALLMSGPDTLCHIAERLNIPQRYVFGFYSACNALELSGNANRQVDNLFQPTETPLNHPRVMLRKILDHVKRRSQSASSSSIKNGTH